MLMVVEETIHLRKSKPVQLVAGIIWALIGITSSQRSHSEQAYDAAAQFGGNHLDLGNCARLCGRHCRPSIH